MQIFIIFKPTIETHLTNVVMFIDADCMLHVNWAWSAGAELNSVATLFSSVKNLTSWHFPHRLINQEGSLLSYAGSGDKDAKVTAAIASSIWAAYEKNGKMAFHNDELKMIFMDCEVCILNCFLQ